MFRTRKVQEFSFNKTNKKFSTDRESIQRIKHLRYIIENINDNELKDFFKKNYSLIFNAFYDVFMNVQMELQQKVTTSHFRELQNILAVFEKILTFLPELINKKWQYCCIYTIMRTLLHSNNILKIRLHGMQLFILWFQILGINAPKQCFDIFIKLIPKFEAIIKKFLYPESQRLSSTPPECISTVNEIEIKPVLTQNLDKEIELDDVDQYLLRYLLRYIVTEGIKVEWEDEKEKRQLLSYTFLLDQFKEYILPIIFPKCISDYTIERNMQQSIVSIDFLENYSPVDVNYPIEGIIIFQYQEEVIRWMAELVYIDNTNTFSNIDSKLSGVDIIDDDKREMSVKTHSGTSKAWSIDNVLVKFDKENLKIEKNAFEKMHQILFENEENINIINQLCQHAFYLPLQYYKTHFSIIFVYKSWLFSTENNQPLFMTDTDASSPIIVRGISNLNDSINDVQKVKISPIMQRVIFTNVATVFLHTYKDSSNSRLSPTKKQQINGKHIHSELTKRIMAGIYRKSVNGISNLDNEHLMNVLLDISFNVLSCISPSARPDNHWITNDASIGQFFQTLNVLLIKSNLVSYISEELWNRFLKVYSTLVNWTAVISEWKKTMDLILKMLGKILYNVDMTDLPLDKKVRRGRPGNNLKRSNGSKLVKRLFSNDDSNANINSSTDPIQSNQVNYNMSLNSTLNIHPKSTFTEGLNQNIEEESVINPQNRNIRSDMEELNYSETNRNFQFEELNENDAGSFASSSHEENSSYMSAEDSSSPHQCKDKPTEVNSGLVSDNEFIPLSSSGGDTSLEINSSFDVSIKPLYNEDNEDNNIDADDEYEGEVNSNVFPIIYEGESKSATLTKEESDIDISSHIYRFGENDMLSDSSRTPTKHTVRRKGHQSKEQHRNSIYLDDNIVNVINTDDRFSNQAQLSSNVNCHHVLLGGTIVGWSQESAVLLWKRCIGLLGNVSQISGPEITLIIFEYFSELTNSFIKMRENMCIPSGTQITPPPPLYVPPIDYIVPWLFELFTLEAMQDDVKIIALKTLCKITIRKLDIEPSIEHLVQFYNLIHSIIYNKNMVLICTLIESLGVYFFSMPLCGSEVIICDIICACEMILNVTNIKSNDVQLEHLPKLEAISILGSLIKFQDHYGKIKTFDSSSKEILLIDCVSYKTDILRLLTFCSKNETTVAPRILSITTIAVYCYVEVINSDISLNDLNDVRQSILLLLSLMRFNNDEIATIAVDMIRFLIVSSLQIQEKLPHIPEKIIQVLSWTLNITKIRCRRSPNYNMTKLITTLIFTLVDWCMCLPVNQLLDSNDLHPKGLIHLAFSALENVSKCDENHVVGRGPTTSSLKQTSTDKTQTVDMKQVSTTIPTQPSSSSFNDISGLSIDPLIEFPGLFEVKSIQDNELSNISESLCSNVKTNERIKLAARTALCHLINHIGQFPKNNVLGCLSTCVQEHNDFRVCKLKQISDNIPENVASDDLTSDVFNSSDLQLFVVNGSMIVSLLSINTQELSKSCQTVIQAPAPGGPPIKSTYELSSKESEVRIIIRDLCGKYCWDVSFVHKYDNDIDLTNIKLKRDRDSIPPSPPPRRTLPSVVMTDKPVSQKNIKSEKVLCDQVDILFGNLVTLSPELLSNSSNQLLSSESPQNNLESLVKQQIHDQNTIEYNYFDFMHCLKISHPKLVEKKLRSNIAIEKSPEHITPNSKFYYCRQILNQLGFLSLKHRASIDLIQKSNIYLDLKCIDSLRSRETHKIAVLFVSWGQEDKESILGNVESSLEFNNFISGLGWTVNLETHRGFMGGLESNGKNGKYAPYFANSTTEIMFHVSTWMQSSVAEDKPNKFKHLGNDEVMVIWSENYRNFRSSIMKTEFGDVMIIIYPLKNGLFCINIKTKGELKLFGPLFDGSIVGEKELAGLVRTTAINAGRSIRESKPHFAEYFVARANYMQKAIKKFIDPMSFEDFVENIYGTRTNETEEVSNENVHGTNTSDITKTPSIKVSDISPTSANLESVHNTKGRDSIVSVEWSNNRTTECRK